MKKYISRLYFFAAMVLLLGILTACSGQEDTTVSFAMPYTTDGISLERTGLYATGFSGITVNEYLYKDVSEAFTKLTKEKLNRSCHIAYVTAEQYKEYFADDNRFRIVLVDNYLMDSDGTETINGLWVARKDWIESCPNTFKKTIKGLLSAMNYRAENCNISLSDALADIENDSEPIGVALEKRSPESSSQYEHEYTEVMHYIAIYIKAMKQNLDDLQVSFGEKETNYISGTKMQEVYESLAADYLEMADFSALSAADLTPGTSNSKNNTEGVIVGVMLGLAALLAIAVIYITIRDFIKETKQYKLEERTK